LIIGTFNAKKAVDDFSVVVSYDDIAAKNYSLSAGQYFDVRVEYEDISAEDFRGKMKAFQKRINSLFEDSRTLEAEITNKLRGLKL
jgi:type I restriction enzyme M protein